RRAVSRTAGYRNIRVYSFSLLWRPPPTSPLFPYTTLFRSRSTVRPSARFPISQQRIASCWLPLTWSATCPLDCLVAGQCCQMRREEEHTSELQSRSDLVCRLLLAKKNDKRREYS